MLEIAVITISDRAFKGQYQDMSGPTIVELITEKYPNADVRLTIVPDEKALIQKAMLDKTLKKWMNDFDQTDDILVMGIRI